MELSEIAKELRVLEDEIGLNIDDLLNKLTQELGEFNDAVQKYRGRFCREKSEDTENIKEEAGDLLSNLISICYRLGIDPDEIPEYVENTLRKFKEREELYKKAMKKGDKNFPEIVTLCGSTKFKEQFIEANKKLTSEGKIVLSVGVFVHADNENLSKEQEDFLDKLHLRKIDLSDSIMVIDVENYIGESTRKEIEYAQKEGKKIYYYSKYFIKTNEKKVGIGFGVMILNSEGKVLLGKRHEDPSKTVFQATGTWTMPGGKLHYGESFEEGAKREVIEETGIKLNSVKVFCVNTDMNEYAHFVTIGLFSDNFLGEPRVMEPDEITEWKWFSLNELPEKIYFPSAKVLKNYKEGKFYIE